MSLYRKYRPKQFADVYGQEHVVSTLEHATKNDRLVHAYLFAGSRGTGKTSVARILAKTLMLQGIEDEALQTQIASGVEDGSIVDLLEIDAASNRGIDDIRDIIEKIQFSPVVASAKVYIIDEVHMLTKEAFNALLKTLEEPPDYAYFILATTELNKIPETVQSRCQCFPFRHIKEEDIVRRLQYIADQERIEIEREALRLIAHLSDGGMRDAISLLDQMRSLESITLNDVRARIGTTGHEYIEDVLQAIAEQDTAKVLAAVAHIEEAGIPLDVFTRQLLKDARKTLHAHIEENRDISDILSMQETLLSAIRTMRTSPVPGLVLEAALLKLCGKVTEMPVETKKAPAAKEQPAPAVKQETPVPPPPPPPPDPNPTQEPVQDEPPEQEEDTPVSKADISLEVVRTAWADIVNSVTPASVKMSLKNGRLAHVENDAVTVAFPSAFHRDKVKAADASRAVEEVLKKLLKADLKLKCELEHSEPEPLQKKEPEEVVNLADAAAEIF